MVHSVEEAALAVLTSGDRNGTAYLMHLLKVSFANSLQHCPLLQTLESLTTPDQWWVTHFATVHLLSTLLSSFCRRRMPTLLKQLPPLQVQQVLTSTLSHAAPTLLGLMCRVAACPLPALQQRLHEGLGCTVAAMMLLQGVRDIVKAIDDTVLQVLSQFPGEIQCKVSGQLMRSAVQCVSDRRLSIGPITRSTSRLMLQKNMDMLLISPVQDSPRLLIQCLDFLTTSSTASAQEQCPQFFETLYGSTLWNDLLSRLQTTCEMDTVDALYQLIASITAVDCDSVLGLLRDVLSAASARPEGCLAKLLGAVMEGPIEDILLQPAAQDLLATLQSSFERIVNGLPKPSPVAVTEEQMQMVSNTLLLLGTLRLADIPTMEDDDDPDDFEDVVTQLTEANRRREACTVAMRGFLSWMALYLIECGNTFGDREYKAMFRQWLECDDEAWSSFEQQTSSFALAVASTMRGMWKLLPDVVTPGGCLKSWMLLAATCDTSMSVESMLSSIDVSREQHGLSWYIASLVSDHVPVESLLIAIMSYPALGLSVATETLRIVSRCRASAVFSNTLALPSLVWNLLKEGRNTSSEIQRFLRALLLVLNAFRDLDWNWSANEFAFLWEEGSMFSPFLRLTACLVCWKGASHVPEDVCAGCSSLLTGSYQEYHILVSDPAADAVFTFEELMQLLGEMYRSFSGSMDSATKITDLLLQWCIFVGGAHTVAGAASAVNEWCMTSAVRGSALHARCSELMASFAAQLTCTSPISVTELCEYLDAAEVFECGRSDWYLSLVSWLVQQPQVEALYFQAVVRFVCGVARGCSVIVHACDGRTWWSTVDALFDFAAKMLSEALTEDSSEESDDITAACGRLVVAGRRICAPVGKCSQLMLNVLDAADEYDAADRMKSFLCASS